METGFNGNGDLYGIGIRIGYYTTALSLWIGSLWAPSETYFLLPLTQTFLIALLIGIAVDSMHPAETYAIEPFICMQVAYFTHFMSYFTPKTPNYLLWERDYWKKASIIFVGYCLHGYDIWYWWAGKAQMKTTPGTQTLGLFVYFGRQDIFQWIYYPVRVYLTMAMIAFTVETCRYIGFHHLEKRMNREVPLEHLQEMAERWAIELGSYPNEPVVVLPNDHLSPPQPSRRASNASSYTESSCYSASRVSCSGADRIISGRTSPVAAADKKEVDYEEKVLDFGPGERGPLGPRSRAEAVPTPDPEKPTDRDSDLVIRRTLTARLKYRLLGWKQDEVVNVELDQEYHPTLERLHYTSELLKSLQSKSSTGWRYYLDSWGSFFQLWLIALTKGLRMKVLLAVILHMSSLCCMVETRIRRRNSYSTILLKVVKDPKYEALSADDIVLSSRIILSCTKTIPLKGKMWCGPLYIFLGTIVQLVLGTELTLQWNYIQGIQSLRTVGQLIPAAIGVGGLVKVLWTALFEREEQKALCFGRCHGDARRRLWSCASETFVRAEAALEQRQIETGQSTTKEEV